MKSRSALTLVASLLLLTGCSGESSQSPQATSANAASKPEAAPGDPIAAVAYDFMDAVFANDIARATQRLTPLAIENMQAQDKRFEWGAAAAKLQTGAVRVDGDEAAVACFVTAEEGQEELLCVLRRIGSEWRVYGVAWQGSESGDPQVVNFEQLPPSPPQQQSLPASGNRYVESPAPQIPPISADPAVQPQVAERPAGLVQ